MKQILLVAAFFGLSAGVVSAQSAQSSLSGEWKAELTPEGMGTFDFLITMEQSSDSLAIWMLLEEGRVDMYDIGLEDDRLQFTMPMHGDGVECSVARRTDDLFAGVCVGPMGESVALLRRMEDAEEDPEEDE